MPPLNWTEPDPDAPSLEHPDGKINATPGSARQLGLDLEGASIAGTKISGTYFPKELSAEEINLSLQHGTRMRYR